MSPSHRNSLHLHRHPTSPDFLPRASGEAADVALCSRRPRQRRWAQTRPGVGGGVRPWRSSGDDPGKGREQGSLGPLRGGEWGRKPSPKSRVCGHFLLLRYADPVSARHPQTPPPRKNSRPVISARPEKTAPLVQGGGNPRPRGKLQNPESWSSPAPAEMGGRRDWCPCCEANDGDAQSRPTGRV